MTIVRKAIIYSLGLVHSAANTDGFPKPNVHLHLCTQRIDRLVGVKATTPGKVFTISLLGGCGFESDQ